jgi:hypothetical protein
MDLSNISVMVEQPRLYGVYTTGITNILWKAVNLNLIILCLYGLLIRVPDYRSKGPGSIPGDTRFFEKWVWNGVHSAS